LTGILNLDTILKIEIIYNLSLKIMNKILKLVAAGSLVAVSLGLSGCQNVVNAPGVDPKVPEVVLQDAMSKLADVTSYSYDMNLAGDLHAPVDVSGVVQKPENIKLNLNFNGGVDLKTAKDPKLNLNLKGDVMADADGGNGEFSLRMNKDAVYGSVISLAGKGQVQIPEELKTQVIGKWWTMAVPPEALDELAKSLPQGNNQNLTAQQKKLKDLVQKTKFFKDVKFVAVEDVKGEQSNHYSAVLDKAAFSEFVFEAVEIQNEKMTNEDESTLKESLDSMDFTGDLYVGKDSGVLNKMKGVLTLQKNANKPAPTGTMTFDVIFADLNKPVSVEVPKDAQPVPTNALMSLMSM
jgi:hypothetical protein